MLLYAITILVSAFLLFQVQPVIAKIILPWFGGSAAVWTTCLLFFQMALLLGYLYSHILARYLRRNVQTVVHVTLLVASALALPIIPHASWKPADPSDPILRILGLLALTVGLPYFMLATTGPLLQAWYARCYRGAMPYRLYALSNAGSMLALLSYPVLFEPKFGTHEQARMWSIGYGAFIVLCAYTAFRSMIAPEPAAASEPEAAEAERPGWRMYLSWLLMPACASALLLAITSHLSQNVAAIPLLWVLPLSVYLLSFILCFESAGWYRRNPYMQLLAVAVASMAYAMFTDNSGNLPIKVGVPLFLMGLFTCCMVCHGELARLKPDPRYVTHYYLMISAGGALGGLLVGVVAPMLFNGYYELSIGLVVCAALAVASMRIHPDATWQNNLLPAWRYFPGVAAVAGLGLIAYRNQSWIIDPAHNLMGWIKKGWEAPDDFDNYVLEAALLIVSGLVLAFLRGDLKFRWARKSAQWMAFLTELATLLVAGYVGYQTRESISGNRVMVRNFYGGLKVHDSGNFTDWAATRGLTHGTINHGQQFLNPARRYLPTTYYGPNTGIGVAIRAKEQTGPIRVGVIGLGTGTIASYGREGDYYRYYEINPLVYRLSFPPNDNVRPQFTFLRDCAARHEVAMGDARLSLERESPQNFDVIAVDAFSSDSIPVHLLTYEAMQLFFRHLKPDGILAVHVSNRYLDLVPVVDEEAHALGKLDRLVDTDDDDTAGVFAATWVLVSSAPSAFDGLVQENSTEIKPGRKIRLWTDDYSNLFQILR